MAPSKSALPALSPDGNLSRYLEQIRSFPMLEPEQEYMLAKSWMIAAMWTPRISL